MASAAGSFQLGLLPERRVNKRAMAVSYGLVLLMLFLVIVLGLLVPERIELRQYRVTQLIPLPGNRREPEPVERPKIRAKLLPAVRIPVFEKPKLLVPAEVRKLAPQQVVAWMLEDRLRARFQLQLHKFIWPPEARER